MPASKETRWMITCSECGVGEGQYHKTGCYWEICPFCGGLLFECSCYEIETGNPDISDEEWQKIVDEKGRYPFFKYLVTCVMCGESPHDIYTIISKEEKEKYIQPDKRNGYLCGGCFEYIKELTEENNARPS